MKRRKRIKQRAAVGRLGKVLTRRSRGACELCGSTDEAVPFELTPFPEEPDPERTLMACLQCRRWLERGGVDPMQAHFLNTAVWSQERAVQLAAARLVLASDSIDDPWVRDAIDALGVDPETGEFRGDSPAPGLTTAS